MQLIQSKIISELKNVQHGFFDKTTGSSGAEITSLYGFSELGRLNQVHGNRVVVMEKCDFTAGVPDADAMITSRKGFCVAVKTADCVPVLLCDKSAQVVGAVHAGWRGTAREIVREALSVMGKEFGSEPCDIAAAIGPSIRSCCYEVDHDVASLFVERFGRSDTVVRGIDGGKYMLNLEEANRILLAEAGVSEIDILGVCTRCNENFHSYRRDGRGVGGQLSFIGLC